MVKKWIDLAFEIGDEVYLKTDKDQSKRLITALNIRRGRISYECSLGSSTSWHDDFEITAEIDVLAKVISTE